jgi:ribosomal-protein-alanine N-acetyltransferase
LGSSSILITSLETSKLRTNLAEYRSLPRHPISGKVGQGGKTMFPSPIETPRLTLRCPTLGDAEAMFANYGRNPRVTRYLSWPTQRSASDAATFLRETAQRTEREEEFVWVIVNRERNWLCGSICLRLSGPVAEVGYCLAEEAWGQGIATEAARAIVPLAWSRPEVAKVEAVVHVDHMRSARVLEKAGLRYAQLDRAHSVLPALGRQKQDMLRYELARPRGV